MIPQSLPPGPPPPVPLLLTRPAEQGAGFAAQLAARFGARLHPIAAPLMAPRFLAPVLPEGVAGLVFTSRTGVAAWVRLGRGGALPAWCVGDGTAEAARAAGLDAISAAGDAEALFALLAARRPPGLLLHLRGAEARGNLAARLGAEGVELREAVVYDQQPLPLPPAARDALGRPVPLIVPLFSPRTARLFVAALAGAAPVAPLRIAALSPAVAEALGPLAPADQRIAARPEAAAMLEVIAGFLDAPPGA